MLALLRRALLIVLMLGLPVQGWAAAQMTVRMGMALGMQVGIQDGMPAALSHDHHGHADPSASAPECCEGDAIDHGDSAHGACAESCHCCISAAPPIVLAAFEAGNARYPWARGIAPPPTLSPAYTLDKPPKN